MGEKLNKYDYQNRELMFRSQKREQYLSLVRKIDSMNPKQRNNHHLSYKLFLTRKIRRIEQLMGIETN